MATRKPLVLVAGKMQQLQAGDSLSVGGSSEIQVAQTNDEATPIVIGSAVYNDAADGVKKARADALGTTKVLGLVLDSPSITNGVSGNILVSGIITLTTAQWDAIAGTTGGLAFGVRYYLSPTTAGSLTSTAPSTVGQYVVQIGMALSTTEMIVEIQTEILL